MLAPIVTSMLLATFSNGVTGFLNLKVVSEKAANFFPVTIEKLDEK